MTGQGKQEERKMREKRWKKIAALGLTTVLAASSLTGCRFGFASDPDDENAVEKEVPIDMSVDTFDYDDSLNGTQITMLNSKAEIQAAPSKQIMLDGKQSTEEQQAAAREFLNWMVFSEIGQQMLVKTCNLIPPFKNNPNEPADPLSRDIYERVKTDGAFNAAAIVPNDHWSVLGAAMQKYLAGRCDREELMETIQKYWDEQK